MTSTDPGRTRAWIERLWWRGLGVDATARSRDFLRHVAYLAGTDVALSALTFFATAGLIRRLGPEEFGLANLVMTVALFCAVPALFGLPSAAMHYLAASRGDERCVGSVLALSGLVPAVLLPALALGAGALAPLLRVDATIFLWGVLYTVPLAASMLAQSLMSGLQQFRALAVRQAVAGLVFLVAVLAVLALVQALDFRHFLGLTALRWLLFAALAVAPLVGRAGRPARVWCSRLLRLGSYHVLTGFAHLFALSAVNSVILNAYHGAAAVGLYGAYFAVFNIFVSRFMKIVSDVLQPSASATASPARLIWRVRPLFWRASAPLVAATTGVSWLLFQFYGPGYTFGWLPALLMALGVTLSILNGVAADILAACGVRGGRVLTWTSWCAAGVNLALNLLLVPSLAVEGTLAATIGAVGVTVWLRLRALAALARDREEPT